jgi:two-component system cell cycle response regulator DivK
MKVLVADDDPVLAHLLRSGLREKGWEVEVASDAMQAVMFTMRAAPDAIVLDINMPGGTGTTALKRLKASTKTRFIPVLVLSGSTDPGAAAEVRALGAEEFMAKPVDIDPLDTALRRLLGSAA